MKKIANDIKTGNLQRAYLLYGEETYLVRLYEAKIKDGVVDPSLQMMNTEVFLGKACLAQDIINSSDTVPFLSDKRLVLVRDSGFFATGRKDESEKIAEYFKNIPETTTIVFSETNVDKRSKAYKKIIEAGYGAEFNTPQEKELVDWVIRLTKNESRLISTATAMTLVQTVAHDMASLEGEVGKLVSYTKEGENITKEIIEKVCTPSLEIKIFDMVKALGNKDGETALDIYSNMLLMKESPIMIITMIVRQFRLMLQCSDLGSKGMSQNDIATETGQRSFVVRECLSQSRNFTMPRLLAIINKCLETDTNIKSGKMGDKLAVEMLIIEILNQ